MARAISVQLQKNLNEVNYPISKKDLIKYAEQKGVDERVLRTLKQIPSQQYETSAAVSEAVGNVQ
ncbi:DUF2795 domain-containing protein [Iningainema tapete]|uniref:DUF2795 domain-containing protein n=1 Tax=Iningainema tapete BLCC-T55 TaxID=2748662 RepID=A0A8J6XSM1_9CYAN|nr:DUF2795 domain-containing protein [Iningainema tapete]MBD2775837.1 DUF2795 domain-containing protein [Iningainema tapete BLCC-T55]